MLTTHYVDLCKALLKNKMIENKHMKIEILHDDVFDYTYKLTNGVSKIKGGLKVLKDLNYPKEVVDISEKFLNNI